MASQAYSVENFVARLIEQDQPLQLICQSAPMAICLIEMPSQRYLMANEYYCNVVRPVLNPESIVGKTIEEVLPNPNRDALNALFVAHEKNISTKFSTLVSSSMSKEVSYWTGAAVPVLRTPDRTLVLALLSEITDKVVAEETARAKQVELENALKQVRDEQLRRDTFIAMAVHELRTPLTSLKVMSGLAERFLETGDISNLKEVLKKLDGQATNLSGLIADLYETTKIITEKRSIDLNVLPVVDLVQEVLQQFSQMHPSRVVEFKLQDDTHVPKHCISVDAQRFSQVLFNLLNNAANFSQATDAISIRLSSAESTIRLSVIDQGAGIATENLEKIFERFFQAQQTQRNRGLGLGLYIARDLVTRMGGRIWVESAGLNAGSEFHIELPLVS
jgi:signal transduction histidine kinase